MSDINLQTILENIEEMKQEQLQVEGNESDNKNGDSNFEREQ